MSERRAPKAGPPPKFNVPPGDLGTLHRWSENLSRWLGRLERDLVDGHSGQPATHGSGHDADGDDPLSTPGTPTTITPDTTADAGDGPAYAYEDHEHGITCAAPSAIVLADTAGTPSEGASSSFARADHSHGDIKREMKVVVDDALIGTRAKLNLKGGTNVTLTGVDDSGGDEVEVTVAMGSAPPSTIGIETGRTTLVAGTVVVNNVNVTAASRLFLTAQVGGGTPGFLYVSARTPSTSFTITSSSGTDTSTVAWLRIEPEAVTWFGVDGMHFVQAPG